MRFICFLFIIFGNIFADKVEVYIAPFKGDRKAAITYTFDDGLRSQYTKALPVLENLGLKATFFIVPGLTPNVTEDARRKRIADWGSISWNEWVEVAAMGHEIGNHSFEHKNLAKESELEINRQVNEAQQLIKEKLGITALSFCYPYNSRNELVDSIIDKKFPFSRKHQIGFGGKMTTEMMNDKIDKAKIKGSWEVVMIHAITLGYDQFKDPQQLYDHWKYVKSIDSEIWADTFSAIGQYKELAKHVKLKVEKGHNELNCLFSEVKKSSFNTSLTLVVKVKAETGKAVQTGISIPVKVLEDKILIDVEPSKGPVDIIWN